MICLLERKETYEDFCFDIFNWNSQTVRLHQLLNPLENLKRNLRKYFESEEIEAKGCIYFSFDFKENIWMCFLFKELMHQVFSLLPI